MCPYLGICIPSVAEPASSSGNTVNTTLALIYMQRRKVKFIFGFFLNLRKKDGQTSKEVLRHHRVRLFGGNCEYGKYIIIPDLL